MQIFVAVGPAEAVSNQSWLGLVVASQLDYHSNCVFICVISTIFILYTHTLTAYYNIGFI